MSMLTSEKAQSEAFSELNEDDEWVAIQKFNTLLHYEEQKQSIMRDAERKRLIRQELDNQMNEKKRRAQEEKKEQEMYDVLQEQHLKLLDQREREKLE